MTDTKRERLKVENKNDVKDEPNNDKEISEFWFLSIIVVIGVGAIIVGLLSIKGPFKIYNNPIYELAQCHAEILNLNQQPIFKNKLEFRVNEGENRINIENIILNEKYDMFSNCSLGIYEVKAPNFLVSFFKQFLGMFFKYYSDNDKKMKEELEQNVKEIKSKIEKIESDENTEIHFIVENNSFIKSERKKEVYFAKLKDIDINRSFYKEDILKLEKIK